MTRPRGWAIPVLGVVLAGIALWLIFTDDGGSGSRDGAPPSTAAGASLDLEDSSQASVEKLSGLDLPDDASGFLSAQLDDGSQLDLTATFPASEETAFLTASHLAAPVADERVVTHASPLWELTPAGTIRGVTDTFESVHRAVELIEEADGTIRIRAVITPAG